MKRLIVAKKTFKINTPKVKDKKAKTYAIKAIIFFISDNSSS